MARSTSRGVLCAFLVVLLPSCVPLATHAQELDVELLQIGKMRQVIGMQQHQGRIGLQEVIQRPHFYGVAALEGLQGEVSIFDSQITASRVDSAGRVGPLKIGANDQATLLIGGYVDAWHEHEMVASVAAKKFDDHIERVAQAAGIQISRPFPFVISGKFTDVRLHVINGACPVHAKLHAIDLPAERRPFRRHFKYIQGKVVGIFAKNAAGNMTHPGTSVHVHLIFQDDETGATLTGHLEQLGVSKGSILKLPAMR